MKNEENKDNIFYCDKSDWYVEKDGQKDWSKSKDDREKFWQKVRTEKMDKGDFNFSQFVFPSFSLFEDTFWLKTEGKRTFSKDINFRLVQFSGEAYFGSVEFCGIANFDSVKFKDEADFGITKFFKGANFINSEFLKKSIFGRAEFSGNIDFIQVKFQEEIIFFKVHFSRESIGKFNNAEFVKKAIFNEAEFLGEVDFDHTNFHEVTDFIKTKFVNVNFSFCSFSKDRGTYFTETVFENIANFKNVIFPEQVIFRQSELSKLLFQNSNIEHVQFRNCTFKKKNGGLILRDEKTKQEYRRTVEYEKTKQEYEKLLIRYKKLLIRYKKLEQIYENSQSIKIDRELEKEYKKKTISYEELRSKLKQLKNELEEQGNTQNEKITKSKTLEELYRQLKKNFANSQHWEKSGQAYVSEMRAKQRRYGYEIYRGYNNSIKWYQYPLKFAANFFLWFIFGLYQITSNYTQDFIRPLVALTFLIISFAIFYSFKLEEGVTCLHSLRRSITYALPYIDKSIPICDREMCAIYASYLERVLGTTFLAFFILALRKRFKQ